MKVFTYGYKGARLEELQALANTGVTIVDTRFRAASRVSTWNKSNLQKNLGDSYVHVPTFGNENYKGGPIKLADPESGIRAVTPLLEKGPIALLCVCSDPNTCHRKDVAEYIQAHIPGVEIEHLVTGKAVGGTTLF